MASSLNASTSGGGGVIVTSDASGNLNIQSGGSTVVAVTSTGATVTGTLAASGASTFTGTGKFATTIGVGNATPSASGSGITFPATQSASSDANTLDDYEEGTWTPSLGGTTTYLAQTGYYTKIGNVVTVYGVLYINAIGTGSVNTISGLPFNASQSSFIGIQAFGTINTSVVSLIGNTTNAAIGMYGQTVAGTSNQSLISTFKALAYVEFFGAYRV